MTPKTVMEIVCSHRRSAPVSVAAVARDLGIPLFKADWRNGASGCIRPDPEKAGSSGYEILTNAAHPDARRRYTIAHEIGHYVLHLESIGRGVTDDGLYRSRLGGTMETQANRFAAWLLMPMGLIRDEASRGANTVEALAKIFFVPTSAMSIRLQVPFETD